MKNSNRIIGIFLSLSLMMGTTSIAFATSGIVAKTSGRISPNKVIAYVRPEYAVQLNNKLHIFKNEKGQRVYPIVYNGNTYLPVRAVSALMNEEIQWDNNSKTIYIGKTLNNPNKSKIRRSMEDKLAVQGFDQEDYIKPTWNFAEVTVKIRPDITIMYDFEIQKFVDESGNRMYPIVYEGSTYLPVRSVSNLMSEPIEWDSITKTIFIGNREEKAQEENEATIYTKRLKAEMESAIELYDQATAKIVNIQKITDAAIKVMLADSISTDVQTAEKQTITINNMKKSKMTEEEKAAQEALYDFVKISEHYLMILENIAYLASSNEEYSMLADTFVNFALDSQSKMNKARKLIEAL